MLGVFARRRSVVENAEAVALANGVACRANLRRSEAKWTTLTTQGSTIAASESISGWRVVVGVTRHRARMRRGVAHPFLRVAS